MTPAPPPARRLSMKGEEEEEYLVVVDGGDGGGGDGGEEKEEEGGGFGLGIISACGRGMPCSLERGCFMCVCVSVSECKMDGCCSVTARRTK